MIREGLRGLLYAHEDLTIVGEACDGEEALSLTDKLRPDCVIMDVNMPRMDGIEATRRLKAAFGGTAVIGLSVNASRESKSPCGAPAWISSSRKKRPSRGFTGPFSRWLVNSE